MRNPIQFFRQDLSPAMSDIWDPLNFVTAVPDGRLLVWEQAITSLEEQITHLKDRAKYYEETPNRAEFIEVMQDLISRIGQIRKTAGDSLG